MLCNTENVNILLRTLSKTLSDDRHSYKPYGKVFNTTKMVTNNNKYFFIDRVYFQITNNVVLNFGFLNLSYGPFKSQEKITRT